MRFFFEKTSASALAAQPVVPTVAAPTPSLAKQIRLDLINLGNKTKAESLTVLVYYAIKKILETYGNNGMFVNVVIKL